MLLQDLLHERFVAKLGCLREAKPRRAALHEEIEDSGVAELMCDHVRRFGIAEAEDVDGAAGF